MTVSSPLIQIRHKQFEQYLVASSLQEQRVQIVPRSGGANLLPILPGKEPRNLHDLGVPTVFLEVCDINCGRLESILLKEKRKNVFLGR